MHFVFLFPTLPTDTLALLGKICASGGNTCLVEYYDLHVPLGFMTEYWTVILWLKV
jgi:hypothetical protein